MFDYGLYLIDNVLCGGNKSLRDWPTMPLPQNDWAAVVYRLIAEQRSYNIDEQAQLAAQRILTLNPAQRSSFDAIVNAVETQSGQTFFLHGPGGTGKTYVYNTLCYFLCGQGKIVLCVASSGIASLLLLGGRTSHSTFKIPIEIHESSMCTIPRNSDMAELIRSCYDFEQYHVLLTVVVLVLLSPINRICCWVSQQVNMIVFRVV